MASKWNSLSSQAILWHSLVREASYEERFNRSFLFRIALAWILPLLLWGTPDQSFLVVRDQTGGFQCLMALRPRSDKPMEDWNDWNAHCWCLHEGAECNRIYEQSWSPDRGILLSSWLVVRLALWSPPLRRDAPRSRCSLELRKLERCSWSGPRPRQLLQRSLAV